MIEGRMRVPRGVLFRQIGEEAVVLDTNTGRYFGLNSVGTRVWSRLAAGAALATTVEELCGDLDVGEDRLRQDLVHFVHNLVEKRLVVREPAL